MKIQPRLVTFDLTMIVVGLVIGMGIFRTPSEVAQKAGVPLIFFLAWITGAVVSLFGALTFAEIGSRHPSAGGFYKIFSHCYHPAFAFMVNWVTVISNAASTAGVALIGADYLYPVLFPGWERDAAVLTITVTSVSLLYIVNMLGIKISARILNGLMILKISLLLLLIFTLSIAGHPQDNVLEVKTEMSTEDMLKAFALCFIPVFFTYGGYQQTMNFGSDVQNPSRTMPKAIFMGIAIVLFIYLTVNYSYVSVLGFEQVKKSTTLASDMGGILFGNMAYKVISVLMFFSVMAYVNVSVLSNPRVYYAMAEDRVLPPVFARVNPRTQVQEFSVTVFCAFIILTLFFLSSLQKILEYVMFFDSISLVTAAACIFILRKRAKKKGELSGIFKIRGYPFIPVFYIAVYSMVNVSVLMANPNASLMGFILFVSGLPLFYLLRGKTKNSH